MFDNNENLPLKQLQVLPKTTKLAASLNKQLLDGEYNPLEIRVFLKKVSALEDKLFGSKSKYKEKLNDLVDVEFQKYKEGKTAKIFNATITETDIAYYSYKECNDDLWNDLDAIEKQVKELKTAREKELQALHPDKMPTGTFGIPNKDILTPYTVELKIEKTTEVFEVQPPVKRSKTSLRFTL